MKRPITVVSLAFAIIMVALSVVAAVYGYEVDEEIYRLTISQVSIDSHDTLSFKLSNNRRIDFDLNDLHEYTVEIDGVKTRNRFSHSLEEPLPMIGILEEGEYRYLNLPYDHDDSVSQRLVCDEPLTIEIYTFKGRLVARWVGIPPCSITTPKALGLQATGNPCRAEFFDGTLRISWELTDYDASTGKVQLTKTAGKKSPVTSWHPSASCPDLESGFCKTEVSSVMFDGEDVFVTLHDMRLQTTITLSNVDDEGTPCLKKMQQVMVQQAIVPEPNYARAPGEPIEIGGPEVKKVGLISEPFELQQDMRDTRVCLEGCKAGNDCYDEGARINYLGQDVFCRGKSWMVHKKLGKSCDYSFECAGSNCFKGVCEQEGTEPVRESWLTRLLGWIDNLI